MTATPETKTDAGEFRMLRLNQLVESKTNPRTQFNDVYIAELAASIAKQGIVQPIVVRPRSVDSGRPFLRITEDYEIVAGACRYRAAKRNQLAYIPAIIRHYSDAQVIKIQCVENLQRRNIAPLDEARAFKRLQGLDSDEKMTVPQIAKEIGKSEEYVYARLKLLDAIAPVQTALQDGKLKAEHATILARLPSADQVEGLKWCTDTYDPMPVQRLRQWAKERDDRHKTQQRVQGEISRAKAAGTKTVDITANPLARYHTSPRGVLKSDQYAPAGKTKCEHLALGFVLDDVYTGKGRKWLYTGRSLKVCTKPQSCLAHKDKASSPTHAASRKKTPAQLAAARKERAKAIARDRLITTIAQKIHAGLGARELDIILHALVHRIWHDRLKAVCKRRDWEPKKKQYGLSYRHTIYEQIAKMSRAERNRFLFELALQEHVGPYGVADELRKIAKTYRVDITKLERQALAELTKSSKKKPKPTAKKMQTSTPKKPAKKPK